MYFIHLLVIDFYPKNDKCGKLGVYFLIMGLETLLLTKLRIIWKNATVQVNGRGKQEKKRTIWETLC
jgi:hypothetical protein